MFSRKTVASVAVALMILVGVASARAGMTDLPANSSVLDQVNNLAAQARAAGGSSTNVAIPLTPGSAPLTKFSATGRLTESLASGACANNPIAISACSSVTCDALTLTGTVNGTSVGKSTLNICFTLFSSSSGACLGNGLGIGTLTAATGDAVNLSFAGNLCINDENISTVTLFLTSNLTYLVEGGTGKFLTETGTGNMAVSTILVNPSGSPIPGTGQIAITGTLSKN
jgi:hypothetical protein